MAKVHIVGNLRQFTGGQADFDLPAKSVQHLFKLLIELYPETAPHLAEGMAVAIDGQIFQETLFQEIGPDAEVFLMPQIAGG